MFRHLALLIAIAVCNPSTVLAAPVAYVLQAEKSDVGFIYKMNGTSHRGSMPVLRAVIRIDFETFANSQVDVTVDVSSARTGLIFANEALRAETVLDSTNHPTIRFQSTAVRTADPRNLSAGGQIDGLLTIRGVTRPVTLNVAVFRQQGTAEGDLNALSFRISGAVQRSRFGATGYLDLVDDTILLDIAARVVRAG